MATIEVTRVQGGEEMAFDVQVQEGRGATQHRVTLLADDYRRLAGEDVTPDELVEESFRFLLEREPKESILRSFDLTVIGRYFPGYEQEIRQRVGGH